MRAPRDAAITSLLTEAARDLAAPRRTYPRLAYGRAGTVLRPGVRILDAFDRSGRPIYSPPLKRADKWTSREHVLTDRGRFDRAAIVGYER